MATQSKKVTSKIGFVNSIIKELNKSPEEKLVQTLEDKVESFKLSTETQISLLGHKIEELKLKLKKAEREIEESNRAYNNFIYDITNHDFESYIRSLEKAEDKVIQAKNEKISIENYIKESEAQIEKYKVILSRFK